MVTKIKKQRKKKSKEEVIFQAIFFVLILFFIGFLAFSNWKIAKKREELTTKIESLKEEIGLLEQEKQQLETGISETEKESYWEEKVREQGYVKEGERSIVVIPPEESSGEEGDQKESFLDSLLEKIKSLLARVVQ
jgi:cell division protein FtsB